MTSTWVISHIWPLCYFSVAIFDDVVFRKFHNKLFITLTISSLIYAIYFSPLTLMESLSGFLMGGVLFLPFVIIRSIGAGDMKFSMVLGALLGVSGIFWTSCYAFVWATIIGLLKVVLSGSFQVMIANLMQISQRVQPTKKNAIPFTVAIFLGWLTWVFYGGGS